jgi:hypothetical protein
LAVAVEGEYTLEYYFIYHFENGMEHDLFVDQEKGKSAINSMINNKFRIPEDLSQIKIKLSNYDIFITGKSYIDNHFRIFKSDLKISDLLDLNKDPSEMKKIKNSGDDVTP